MPPSTDFACAKFVGNPPKLSPKRFDNGKDFWRRGSTMK